MVPLDWVETLEVKDGLTMLMKSAVRTMMIGRTAKSRSFSRPFLRDFLLCCSFSDATYILRFAIACALLFHWLNV